VKFDEKLIAKIMDEIEFHGIDVAMFDPLVALHNVSENDNAHMDALIKKLGWLAMQRNCCIEVAHHSRKGQPGQTELVIDDVRGGSAIVDAFRSVRTISSMSVAEASKAGSIRSTAACISGSKKGSTTTRHRKKRPGTGS
jgi:RecA-family ATPase